jgi:hypothetical protein
MYAAARYNAFNWFTSDEHACQSIDTAATYFRNEYETMFRKLEGNRAGFIAARDRETAMSLTLVIGNKNYSSWSLRAWLQ